MIDTGSCRLILVFGLQHEEASGEDTDERRQADEIALARAERMQRLAEAAGHKGTVASLQLKTHVEDGGTFVCGIVGYLHTGHGDGVAGSRGCGVALEPMMVVTLRVTLT